MAVRIACGWLRKKRREEGRERKKKKKRSDIAQLKSAYAEPDPLKKNEGGRGERKEGEESSTNASRCSIEERGR